MINYLRLWGQRQQKNDIMERSVNFLYWGYYFAFGGAGRVCFSI